ncbi:hypothetical protein [Kutzneria sp. NPDC052558]|uniref:hypothetical protein n=1 Tax=Kutzneria sp. NPDC052558 TaxID=3364121 RepID=UPI0037CA30DF
MTPDGDSLGQRRHSVVVLRLVLDGSGRLSHGELVDTSGRVRGRFGDWEAMIRVLRGWLESGSS